MKTEAEKAKTRWSSMEAYYNEELLVNKRAHEGVLSFTKILP